MDTPAEKTLLPTLKIVLSVHVFAFIVFHLNVGLIFDMRFVRLMLAYEWPTVTYRIMHFSALYLPAATFIWMIFTKRYSLLLLLVMTAVTVYYASKWHYPILTSFLFTIDQFETHGDFVIGRIPGLEQYPEFQSMGNPP